MYCIGYVPLSSCSNVNQSADVALVVVALVVVALVVVALVVVALVVVA